MQLFATCLQPLMLWSISNRLACDLLCSRPCPVPLRTAHPCSGVTLCVHGSAGGLFLMCRDLAGDDLAFDNREVYTASS